MTEYLTILILIFASAEVDIGALPSYAECSALISPTQARFSHIEGFVGVRCEKTSILTKSPRPLPKPEELK